VTTILFVLDMKVVPAIGFIDVKTTGGWMYVIIGSYFVPLEGKFLLIALVIVRITLNVLRRQMPLKVS
jgi:hypothetical protein